MFLFAAPPPIPPPPVLLTPAFHNLEVRPPPLPPRLDEVLTNQPNGPYGGNDVFTRIRNHQMDFWYLSGETVASFQHLVEDITPLLENRPGRYRDHLLSVENRSLLFFYWIKKYPDIVAMSAMFDISKQSVCRELYFMTDVLWTYFQDGITWPTDEEWEQLRGNWDTIPDAVGAIDGTVHAIEIPETEDPPHLFYSGHVHKYCISTQVIIDNRGMSCAPLE